LIELHTNFIKENLPRCQWIRSRSRKHKTVVQGSGKKVLLAFLWVVSSKQAFKARAERHFFENSIGKSELEYVLGFTATRTKKVGAKMYVFSSLFVW